MVGGRVGNLVAWGAWLGHGGSTGGPGGFAALIGANLVGRGWWQPCCLLGTVSFDILELSRAVTTYMTSPLQTPRVPPRHYR